VSSLLHRTAVFSARHRALVIGVWLVVLVGDHVDQSALFGVLERIESLGLELLDVRHLSPTR